MASQASIVFSDGAFSDRHLAANADIAPSKIAQRVLAVVPLSLADFRKHDDLTAIPTATPSSTYLALITGATYGTNAPTLQSGDLKAAGDTTRRARIQVEVPDDYDAGQTIQVRCSAGMLTTIADTLATLAVEAYKPDRIGGYGANLVSTSATSINSLTLADKTFTIDGSTLSPGDMLDVRVSIRVNDAATGTAVKGVLAAAELLVDLR